MYVFCGNNPVNYTDPFGLCEDSFSDKFYDAIDRGATAINDWMEKNFADPVGKWADGVNDWLDGLTTAQKIGVALAPIGGGLLFTEGGMYVLANGSVQYLMQDASSGTPGLIDATVEGYKSLEENVPVILESLGQ